MKTTSSHPALVSRRQPHRPRSYQRAVPVLLLSAWSVLGCYRYVPVELAPTEPIEGRVRLTLNRRGTESVRFTLGEDIRRIEGVVARTTGDSLFLRAEYAQSSAGKSSLQLGVPVAVARADVQSLDSQVAAKGRTLAAVGAVAVVLVLAVAKLSGGAFGSSDDGDTPPPTVTRVR